MITIYNTDFLIDINKQWMNELNFLTVGCNKFHIVMQLGLTEFVG